MKKTVFVILLSLGACGSPPTEAEQWSNEWSDPTPEVMQVLAANSIRGCGEFYQKENTAFRREFAVACNRMPDGSGNPAWVGYQVWAASGDVQGPDMSIVYLKFGGPPRDDPR